MLSANYIAWDQPGNRWFSTGVDIVSGASVVGSVLIILVEVVLVGLHMYWLSMEWELLDGMCIHTCVCVVGGGGGTHCVIEAFNRISMRDIKYLLLDISYWISPIGLSPIGNSLKAYILMKLKIVRIIIILTWEHKVQVQWSPIFDHPH